MDRSGSDEQLEVNQHRHWIRFWFRCSVAFALHSQLRPQISMHAQVENSLWK